MSGCVFCQKIRDQSVLLDMRNRVAYFEPLNPVTPGHRLFIPFDHVEHNDGKDAENGLAHAIRSASAYAQDQGEDFNLVTSSGPAATQTIPHIHIHYVPRREDDGLHLPWTETDHE